MTLFRVNHNKNYTIINNTICKDNRLSWKAKGIFLYAFSRPDTWQFVLEDLIKQSTDGKDSVSAGLRELVDAGYLRRERIRKPDGTFERGAIWDFFETPQELKEVVPETENPVLDNPVLEKPPLLNTDPVISTEKEQQQQPQKPPVFAAVFFDCLKDVDIPEVDKVWLSKKYTEAVVSKTVAWATHPMTKIEKTLQQAIKWGCTQPDLEIPKQKEAPLSNKDKVLQRFTHYERYNGALCLIDDNGIGFERGMTHYSLSFKEKGFDEQLANLLRKFNIS